MQFIAGRGQASGPLKREETTPGKRGFGRVKRDIDCVSTLRHSEAANAFVDGADVAGGVAAQRHRMVLAAAVDDGRDIHAIVDVQRSDAADALAAAAFHAPGKWSMRAILSSPSDPSWSRS